MLNRSSLTFGAFANKFWGLVLASKFAILDLIEELIFAPSSKQTSAIWNERPKVSRGDTYMTHSVIKNNKWNYCRAFNSSCSNGSWLVNQTISIRLANPKLDSLIWVDEKTNQQKWVYQQRWHYVKNNPTVFFVQFNHNQLTISFSSTTTTSTSPTRFSTVVPELISSQGPGASPEQDLGDDLGQELVVLVALPRKTGLPGWRIDKWLKGNGPLVHGCFQKPHTSF